MILNGMRGCPARSSRDEYYNSLDTPEIIEMDDGDFDDDVIAIAEEIRSKPIEVPKPEPPVKKSRFEDIVGNLHMHK